MCGSLAVVATFKQIYDTFQLAGEPPAGGIECYNLPPSFESKGSNEGVTNDGVGS